MASATRTAGRSPNESRRGGRGRVLAAALEHVERFPVLEPARERANELFARGAPTAEIAETLESDVGLAIATLRTASSVPGSSTVTTLSEAVDAVDRERLAGAIRDAPGYELFQRPPGGPDPERFRLHSLLVQRSAEAIAEGSGGTDPERVSVAALLHDTGRLVLAKLHGGYSERFDRRLGTPEERIVAERRELGIDHALVGGVLARRWKLSGDIAGAIERHHSNTDGGMATVIRAADMLAAHLGGYPFNHELLIETAGSCGIDERSLGELLCDLPRAARRRRRSNGPCPLSDRELEVLRGLAEGKVYKQIAYELELSASTVRSHLHNVYGKLGALDRAQAVLMATEHGWL